MAANSWTEGEEPFGCVYSAGVKLDELYAQDDQRKSPDVQIGPFWDGENLSSGIYVSWIASTGEVLATHPESLNKYQSTDIPEFLFLGEVLGWLINRVRRRVRPPWGEVLARGVARDEFDRKVHGWEGHQKTKTGSTWAMSRFKPIAQAQAS